MANEAEKILHAALDRVQRTRPLRLAAAALLVLGLLGLGAYFLYELMPRRFELRVSGGNIIGNRHYVTKALQDEARNHGVFLRIRPTAGTMDALELLNAGELDLAFVQGGLDASFPNVTHVATVGAELVHFFVKPGINGIADLNGKFINLGSHDGGTQVIARQILEFSGLTAGVNYVDTDYGNEALIEMRPEKLPDAIVNLSFAPSYLGDFLVRERGYRLIEVPFPAAMAKRQAWVADQKVLAYMYNVLPPVPERDIRTVGVNLHLVAHANVEPRAIAKTLEALYSPSLESRLRMRFDEKTIAEPSGYPLSAGSILFINRHDPVLSAQTWDRLQSAFGLAMTVLSALLVLVKWFRGPPPAPVREDAEFHGRLAEVAAIEADVARLIAEGRHDVAILADHLATLAAMKAGVLERYGDVTLDDPALLGTLIATLDATRAHLAHLSAQWRPADAQAGNDD